MRKIERTTKFRRDYKRELKGKHKKSLEKDFIALLGLLASDQALPAKYQDHALSGNWIDHRDCHLYPDLVLIYRKPDEQTLQLVRIGSHNELSM